MTLSLLTFLAAFQFSEGAPKTFPIFASRVETVVPITNESFDKGGKAKVRKQGGNARMVDGIFVFDGSLDGNRQVDPQIAVGGGYVFHGTNSGLIIYDKKGNYVNGVPQSEFNEGIDPKLFYDSQNKIFAFDVWKYWDKEKVKPVNISVSKTSDPRGTWFTYPISASAGVDGGGIGHSRKWIGYSFPGGPEQTFVVRTADVRSGKPTLVFHFAGNLGQPVNNQDSSDDLYFVRLTEKDIVITKVADGPDGNPVVISETRKPHRFRYFGYPPDSPMKGTTKRTASGDRNPKGIVLQNSCLWFSQTVDVDGRAGVQWHQVRLDGSIVQSGLIADPINSYIETTMGVNRDGDAVIGFQETGPEQFISARFAYRFGTDKPGTIRKIVKLGEGVAATEGGAWGDYSSTVVDGDDKKSIWTIQSVANEKGRGNCIIARIPFDAELKRKK